MDPAALDGVLVADFSRVLAGPYATMLLADLGATVVKVERPGSGDDTRAWGPPFAPDGQSTYFHSVNRNKRSIALDLTDPDDLAVALNLAQTCDVLVQNYKPGGLRRFGLDHASVAAVNPGVVYCSISGFGSGEGRDLPGYDLLVQAMGGLMSITGDEEPTKAGVAVVDVLTGLHATVAVLAALRHRDLTGSGQHVEVSLLSALLSSLVNQSSAYVGAGEVPQRLGNAHPSIAPYDLFATADRPMIIAVGNDAQFRRLAEVLQRPDLADNPDYLTNSDRVAHRDNLKADLERVLRTHGADDWQRALTASGIPCGPINTIEQAFEQASRLGLDPVVDAGGMPVVANPVEYTGTPPRYRSAPPQVDADRAEVLALLGERS
jgi:crotonobetainyl-CoA:carnitine CoA-transferase CaiB-like acyl-CoA transferase